MYKVAIVGGSGFVGSALAQYLMPHYDVVIVDVRPPPINLKGNIEFRMADVRNRDEVSKALRDVDLVVHTAIVQIPTINEQKRLGLEVNFLGTYNVSRAVDENSKIKGMILAGSWHLMGEAGLSGVINEEISYRPDKVESRARLYVFSKIVQEVIVRYHDEMSDKVFGVIRLGTVIGRGMSEKTAVKIFIRQALSGKPLTPYRHSMYRPMLFVDINDVCRTFKAYIDKILSGEIKKSSNSLDRIVNVFYPEPITVLEIAEIVRDAVIELTEGKIVPRIEIVETGEKPLFTENDKYAIKVDVSKLKTLLGIENLKHPKESIYELVKDELATTNASLLQ